jgi:uncharacterized protein (TIGR03435 family)
MKRTVFAAVTLALFVSARGATPLDSFEVASVKPSDPPAEGLPLSGILIGGPGTASPTLVRATRMRLLRLITFSYDLPPDQVTGPSWLDEALYDINARVPQGATKEQYKAMLRNLLEERFRLRYHKQAREFEVYELTVAKGGAKLKETAYPNATPMRPGDDPVPSRLDADGFPMMLPGKSGMSGVRRNGANLDTYQSAPVSILISMLSRQYGSLLTEHTWAPARIVDKTGLDGKYDFKLQYATTGDPIGGSSLPSSAPISASGAGPLDVADPDGGPDIVDAIEKQLGLRLTKGKATFEILVLDSIERMPTEN